MNGTQVLRVGGRWLMKGPRRQRVFNLATKTARSALDGKIRRGPAAGLRFSGGDTAGYVLGMSEPAVQQALVDHLHPGAVFFDVGANIGFMTVLACRLAGPTGQVHCFEPLLVNLAQLRANLDANGFSAHIHEVALSDSPGQVEMAYSENLGRAHFADDGADNSDRTMTVPTVRLDDLDLPAPTLVKIDVEGAEGHVLRGMGRILREHRPVVLVELHPGHEDEARELLRDAGYTLRELDDAGGMPHVLARPR